MNIRRAITFDADQIAKVHILSRQTIYRDHMSTHVLDNLSYEKRASEWRDRLESGLDVWVVEKEKNIIGFISICPTRDEEDDPTKVMEISAIYLLPEFWRKGLGKKLCAVVFEDVTQKRFKEITLWVLESNHQARNFYESLEFYTTLERRKDRNCENLTVIKYRKIF